MQTKFYAVNEINIEGAKAINPGALVATLESPDDAPVPNIVRALNSGLVTTDEPGKSDSIANKE